MLGTRFNTSSEHPEPITVTRDSISGDNSTDGGLYDSAEVQRHRSYCNYQQISAPRPPCGRPVNAYIQVMYNGVINRVQRFIGQRI
jgi:hypothetical protein